MKPVWLSLQGLKDTRIRGELSACLAKTDIEVAQLDHESQKGAGIVVFGNISPELCGFLRKASGGGRERIICVSASEETLDDGIWSLLDAGASDVIVWDDPDKRAGEIALRLRRWKEIDEILESPIVSENLVGNSHAWRRALRQIVEMGCFTDASVLLAGESGTGKELAARLIHTLDRRANKGELVVLDCTTIVPGLAGSEFFGHERGAFTGAVTSRDGAFALADGGTLFLDEVSELPPELQAQLLRVVQEKCFKRVGGNNWRKSEFRLICATNRDLMEEVRAGRFRHDLYYRIAAWECRLPALRQRSEDILPLARHFMGLMDTGGNPPVLDKAVEAFLLGRKYPGNVRDLRQLVGRIMYRHVGKGPVTVGDIPPEERPAPYPGSGHWCDEPFEKAIRKAVFLGAGMKEIGRAAEDTAVDIVVDAENGNLQRAARRLGVTDRALQLRRANRRRNGAPL